jgi:predicted homoserine dehydrogenase-like protein
MNLHQLALERAANGKPVGVALIGAGKFGSMFLAQVPTMAGIAIRAIADLDPDRARGRLPSLGWDDARVKTVHVSQSVKDAVHRDDVEVVIEATGNPIAGTEHALLAIEAGKHIVMVNVEADVLAGPALAARARAVSAAPST